MNYRSAFPDVSRARRSWFAEINLERSTEKGLTTLITKRGIAGAKLQKEKKKAKLIKPGERIRCQRKRRALWISLEERKEIIEGGIQVGLLRLIWSLTKFDNKAGNCWVKATEREEESQIDKARRENQMPKSKKSTLDKSRRNEGDYRRRNSGQQAEESSSSDDEMQPMDELEKVKFRKLQRKISGENILDIREEEASNSQVWFSAGSIFGMILAIIIALAFYFFERSVNSSSEEKNPFFSS